MTKEELKNIWHEAWNKLANQQFEAFALNCKSEINPNDFIGDCLAKIYNLGVQNCIDNIELLGKSLVTGDRKIGYSLIPLVPDTEGIYNVSVDREGGDAVIGEKSYLGSDNIRIDRAKLLNLKIK